MSLSLDEYRGKLLSRILVAHSQNEVKRFVDASIEALGQHEMDDFTIRRFIDHIIEELRQLDPMCQDPSQWSNSKIARIQLNRIRLQLSATEGQIHPHV